MRSVKNTSIIQLKGVESAFATLGTKEIAMSEGPVLNRRELRYRDVGSDSRDTLYSYLPKRSHLRAAPG